MQPGELVSGYLRREGNAEHISALALVKMMRLKGDLKTVVMENTCPP